MPRARTVLGRPQICSTGVVVRCGTARGACAPLRPLRAAAVHSAPHADLRSAADGNPVIEQATIRALEANPIPSARKVVG